VGLDIRYARSGGVSIAYQVVGDGDVDLVYVPDYVSNLVYAGEVLVSQTVKDLVAGAGLAFTDRGAVQLKGVPGDWRLYAVADG